MPQELGFIVFLALVLAFALPLISTKTGRSVPELLFGRKRGRKPEPAVEPESTAAVQRNDGRKELIAFVAGVGKEAKKLGIRTVVPGALSASGKVARYPVLLVGNFGVIGVYCLGFGGTIEAKDSGDWEQQINGIRRTFPNPLETCRKWEQTGKTAIREAGLGEVLFRSMVAFTREGVRLNGAPGECYDKKGFYKALYSLEQTESDTGDWKRFADQLTALTARTAKQMKTEQGRK